MTVGAALARYLLEHAQYQPSYRDADREADDIIAAIGKDTPLEAITDDMVATAVAKWRGLKDRRYKPKKRKKGEPPPPPAPLVSNTTVNAITERLRAVVRTAARKWGCVAPQINWADHALPEPPGRQRYLTPEEVERVLESASEHIKPGILIALWTGIRLENCIRLDWRQVDLQQRVIRVRQKGDRWHTAPLVGPAFIALANLNPQPAGPVFLYRGRPIKSWRKAWRNTLTRAGIEDFRWHDWRHVCASWLIWSGADLSVVKAILGHATITTTMRYAHLKQDAQREALERVWANSGGKLVEKKADAS